MNQNSRQFKKGLNVGGALSDWVVPLIDRIGIHSPDLDLPVQNLSEERLSPLPVCHGWPSMSLKRKHSILSSSSLSLTSEIGQLIPNSSEPPSPTQHLALISLILNGVTSSLVDKEHIDRNACCMSGTYLNQVSQLARYLY
jgi:hypothetical protein